ncbi:MAG TPA: polyhydroxyalkanoate synthesis repressor PhaR [Caulobacteraceae bacterium]
MAEDTDNEPKRATGERVTIQKYANRRLYNKATSSYITLDDLATMVKQGVDFVVYDAKTGEDITRKVLTQIIFEEEGRGQNLLPIQFLRQLIGFYGDRMQAFLPSFLEMSLDSFFRQQARMQSQWGLAGPPSMGAFDEQIRQNMALFDRAMKMFTPFAFRPDEVSSPQPQTSKAAKPVRPTAEDDELSELKAQMAAMQAQLKALASKK